MVDGSSLPYEDNVRVTKEVVDVCKWMGKEVEADTVPEIVEAIRARFENGEINTIKHATQDGRQVYAVEIRTGATAETVYVLPDGTLLENAATPGGADEADG